MIYLMELLALIVIVGLILKVNRGKKSKNGVFQTITKDTNKNKIIVKTEIIINDKVFDSFKETVIGLDQALASKKLAKKKGITMYKRGKKLMKK
jgi:hypothetical protein